MTATDEALTDQIAYALAEEDAGQGGDATFWDFAAAVLPIIRKAQADAWSDGEAAGHYNTGPRSRVSNPYRTQEDA